MAVVSPGKIYQPLFPRWYNPNVTCAYHGGVLGHSIEQCVAFKHKAQSLINTGWHMFQDDSPNVRNNPFTNHGSSSVNTIEEGEVWELKKVEDVSTPKRFIFGASRKAGMVEYDGNEEDQCLLHPGEFHDVEICPVSKELL